MGICYRLNNSNSNSGSFVYGSQAFYASWVRVVRAQQLDSVPLNNIDIRTIYGMKRHRI